MSFLLKMSTIIVGLLFSLMPMLISSFSSTHNCKRSLQTNLVIFFFILDITETNIFKNLITSIITENGSFR
jgi:hypothetical protein